MLRHIQAYHGRHIQHTKYSRIYTHLYINGLCIVVSATRRGSCVYRFRLEIPFLCKFGQKNQNYQFKLKYGT